MWHTHTRLPGVTAFFPRFFSEEDNSTNALLTKKTHQSWDHFFQSVSIRFCHYDIFWTLHKSWSSWILTPVKQWFVKHPMMFHLRCAMGSVTGCPWFYRLKMLMTGNNLFIQCGHEPHWMPHYTLNDLRRTNWFSKLLSQY